MPYGCSVIYRYRGEIDEILETARAGMLPIVQHQAGFIANGVMPVGEEIVSIKSNIGDYSWLEFASR
jgi:hypothetical protein